jgi:hypothetical protein
VGAGRRALSPRGGDAPLSRVRVFGADEVYAVAGTPQVGAEIRRHFSTDWARRYPHAEYALRLMGEDPEIRRRVEVRFNGKLVRTHEGAARERLPLTPPFPVANRNEVAFRHVYEIPPAVTQGAAYRIGRTAVHSPVDLVVRSAGRDHGNVASIRVNGIEPDGSCVILSRSRCMRASVDRNPATERWARAVRA